MNIKSLRLRVALLSLLMLNLTALSVKLRADTGTCAGVGVVLPFTDVMGSFFFCQIASAYFSGLTTGTTPTTYSPELPVTREQMAAFTTRTLDQSVKRSHTRAALGQWWTNKSIQAKTYTQVGLVRFLASDGYFVVMSSNESNGVSAYDIKTYSPTLPGYSIQSPEQIVTVGNNIYATSSQSPGQIYAGLLYGGYGPGIMPLATVGPNPIGITFDGQSLWTANNGPEVGTGSISRVTIDTLAVTTYTTGFSRPRGILFDGSNLWVIDAGDTSLKRVDAVTGSVLQTVVLHGLPQYPVFDGTNLWIPCSGPDQVYVVRGVGNLAGTVLATLTGNGLSAPFQAAFDGERICVTNAGAARVSLWNATDLSPITSVDLAMTGFTQGVCSDGTYFFIALRKPDENAGYIVRF